MNAPATDPSNRLPWPAPTPAELDALLPQFKFGDLIGRGGMGAVYRAWQRSLDRTVAVKILPVDLVTGADQHFAVRFRQEALTMARLSHPGIVSVYEAGEAGGLLYIVMEFIEGSDVARLIRSEGKLAPEAVTALLAQVCDALHYAHENGVVHRDIKPANLLLTRDGRVKIGDFGLAKHHEAAPAGLTRSNVALGTPDFLAPEAWTPGTTLDGRADVYALGVTLYQMLTGEIPRGFWEMPSARVGTDARFDAIIERALQPKPEARYQSSAELRRDLEKIQTEPRSAAAPGSAGILAGRSAEAGQLAGGDASAPKFRRALIALAVLLAAVLGVLRAFGPAKERSNAGALSTVVVNTNDAGPGSLRQAFLDAANIPGSNTITFAPALAGQSVIVASKPIHIADRSPVTVDGSGLPGRVTINGPAQFFMPTNSVVHFVGLTLTGGKSPDGGILLNDGVTTLTDCLLTGNAAAQHGGALGNRGNLSLVRCTLAGNSAGVNGGAVNNRGILTLTDCTLSRNTAGNGGGAIHSALPGNVTLLRCTLAENTARGVGGAVMVTDGAARFVHGTIVSNHAPGLTLATHGGGGVAALEKARVELDATIVAGNDAATGNGPDLWMLGAVIHSQRSLIGNGKDSILGGRLDDNSVGLPAAPLNPFLEPLGRYGGPTETMPPLPSSPVVDKAGGSTTTHDQRGRPMVREPDIGAAEWQPERPDSGNATRAARATPTVLDAARWLVKCNANLRVTIGAEAFWVRREEDLPTVDFDIVNVYVDRFRSDLPMPTDDDFQVLRAVTTLREVFVRVPGLTDEAFGFLATNPLIRVLTLEGMPDLTDGVLQHFAGLKRIGHVRIIGAGGFTGRRLSTAAWLTTVEAVDFLNTPIDGPAAEVLGSCPRLGMVWVSGEQLTPGALNALFASKSLTNLAITRTPQLTDGMFSSALRGAHRARRIELTSTPFGDLAAGTAATLTNLVELQLRGTRLTDAGLAKLHPLHQLEALHLGYTQVTPAGVAAFQLANPRCRVLTE